MTPNQGEAARLLQASRRGLVLPVTLDGSTKGSCQIKGIIQETLDQQGAAGTSSRDSP